MIRIDEDSYCLGARSTVGEMIGGFFHMAAVPKHYLEGYTFINAIIPGI